MNRQTVVLAVAVFLVVAGTCLFSIAAGLIVAGLLIGAFAFTSEW
jgi:hypothetical protein